MFSIFQRSSSAAHAHPIHVCVVIVLPVNLGGKRCNGELLLTSFMFIPLVTLCMQVCMVCVCMGYMPLIVARAQERPEKAFRRLLL